MERILGTILAGGLARRIGGGDKGRLDLGGQSLIAEVMSRLEPQCQGLVLNANGDPARFSDLGLLVLGDSLPGHLGPLAGVLAGMDHAAETGFTHVLSAAADTPFLPRDLGVRLISVTNAQHPIALAASRDGEGRVSRQPTFGLWPVDLREDLRNCLLQGQSKVSLWAERHGAALAVFDAAGHDPFFNINTPEDLAFARGLWQAMPRNDPREGHTE